MKQLRVWIVLGIVFGGTGCDTSRSFLGGGGSPRQQYAGRLEAASLHTSAMGRQWNAAGSQSLRAPLAIMLPYKEAGFFPPDAPRATGLRFSAQRGQSVRIFIAVLPDTGARLFAGNHLTLIKALQRITDTLTHEVEGEGETFILRLQPELLAAVSYTLTITGAPSLGFPVKGGGTKDIGSLWGDPRDAGARRHEGIDSFGKKRTPVVAAADGTVTRVQETGIGGKVVWMRPEGRGLSLYYAHLDSQFVSAGQRVRTGEVLGLMGNTGNARGTATHLHFGIYGAGGAVNPYYYVAGGSGALPPIAGRATLLDSLLRTEGRAQLLAATADKEGTAIPAGTALKPVAAAGDFYRVVLPDNRTGWVRVGSVKPATAALRTLGVQNETPLRWAPGVGKAVVATVPANTAVRVQAVARRLGIWNMGRAHGMDDRSTGMMEPEDHPSRN